MIRVRRWRPVAAWQWAGMGNFKDCGICQAGLEATCPDCQLPGDECPVVKGLCCHPFHSHCIVKWTAAQLEAAASNDIPLPDGPPEQPHCPMCRQRWDVSDDQQTEVK